MNRHAVLAFLLICVTAYPKTPAQLKADLANLFGTKIARIVFQSVASTNNGNANKLLKVDSQDGIVKDFLVNPPANSFMNAPTFTMDGSRVVFSESNSQTTYVANWSDGVWKKVASGYSGSSNYRNSSGQDMVLCYKSGAKGLYLIDVDNSSSVTQVYPGPPAGEQGPSFISISGDGMYIAADWNGYGTVGVYKIGGPNPASVSGNSYCSVFSAADAVKPPNTCDGGCWTTIARDNTHNVLYTVEPHAGFLIQNGTKKIMDKGFPFLTCVGDEYNGLQWSNDQNFASCFFESDWCNPGYLNLRKNPIIVRLSDLAWTYIQDVDTTSGFWTTAGITGMYVLPGSNTAAMQSQKSIRALASAGTSPGPAFDIRGRLLTMKITPGSDIVISESRGGVFHASARTAMRRQAMIDVR